MRLRFILYLIAIIITACSLPACSISAKERVIELGLDQSSFSIAPWKFDGSHMITAHGRLLIDGHPVAHAAVQVGDQRKLETNDNGTFDIQIDQSKPLKVPLRVTDVEQAALEGKAINKQLGQKLLGTSTEFNVYYPIEITQVQTSAQNPDMVEVHGRAQLRGDASFPTLLVDKYSIFGVVKDAAGNPVKNAIVNIRRSGVEGYAKSEPSNNNGEYSLMYLPEADEDTHLLVHVGDTHYQLPANKVYHFPDDTSIETNIMLPKEGTIIDDKPPTLVSKTAPGAFYKGTLIGLKVNDGSEYSLTIPMQDGSFSLKVPKKIWDQSPPFFETEMSRFSQKPISPGDFVPSTFIQKPGPSEPDHILPIRNP
jgi:hypothetical protein